MYNFLKCLSQWNPFQLKEIEYQLLPTLHSVNCKDNPSQMVIQIVKSCSFLAFNMRVTVVY